jgi:hypothetical protein
MSPFDGFGDTSEDIIMDFVWKLGPQKAAGKEMTLWRVQVELTITGH